MSGLAVETFVSSRPPGLPRAAEPRLKGVATLMEEGHVRSNAHDRASREVLLSRVAGLLGLPVLSPVTPAQARGGELLLVPGDAITLDVAAEAGVSAPRHILGGVVPSFFVGSKSISHGLVDPSAARPAAWSPLMAEMIGGCVLKGYTAFTVEDARRAGRALLTDGPVRIKDVCGKAGLGQSVVASEAELEAALRLEDAETLAHCGLVLEEDLTEVVTYSVGAMQLGEDVISYWGRQNLTRDHQGREVYGGSDLVVYRGDLEALARRPLPGGLQEVVASAACFDRAARLAYPEAILTRRNYDVIEGVDARGVRKSGVLEQSWRVGGASGAEIAALEAFRADPSAECVRCSTVEIYDEVIPPPGAVVYYAGHDPVVGPMTKFAVRMD